MSITGDIGSSGKVVKIYALVEARVELGIDPEAQTREPRGTLLFR